MQPSLGLRVFHLQVSGLLLQRGGIRTQRYLEIEGIDNVQDVTLVDELVVGNLQFRNLPGNLWRYARDLGPYTPVAGPGRHHVMTPSDDRDEYRSECNDQGCESTYPGDDHSRYETALTCSSVL